MNAIERQVMEFLLQGAHPVLAVFRDQLQMATVTQRERTGVGFFTHFQMPATVPRLPWRHRVTISDVHAEVTGLEIGAGFVLFLEDGLLDCLECYIYEEEWPSKPELKRLYYVRPDQPGGGMLHETTDRDFAWAIHGLGTILDCSKPVTE